MPPTSRKSKIASPKTSPKAKRQKRINQQTINSTAFNNDKAVRDGLTQTHKGKRVLIQASRMYRNDPIPEGEEEYLFDYSIVSVNDDCKTAVIQFNEQYIIQDGYQFQNYALVDEEEESLKNYSLSHLDDDHEAYNTHLGRGNKIINDQEQAKRKEEEAATMRDGNDVSDLKGKFDRNMDSWSLILAEFFGDGEVMEHTINSGPDQGKINYKQIWTHKHSGYNFTWHRKVGKTAFQRDRLYKAARVIINKKSPGYERLTLIMNYGEKSTSSSDGHSKYPRGVDMVKRVGAVFAAVGTKLPLGVFDNHHFSAYIRSLDSKHCPPHRLERLRVLEVMMDCGMMEFSKIVQVSTWYLLFTNHFIQCYLFKSDM